MLEENSIVKDISIACWAYIGSEACKIKLGLHRDLIRFSAAIIRQPKHTNGQDNIFLLFIGWIDYLLNIDLCYHFAINEQLGKKKADFMQLNICIC